MKPFTLFLFFSIFPFFSQGQSTTLKPQRHQISIEVDLFSISPSYAFQLHRWINPGGGFKYGESNHLSFTENHLYNHREHRAWFVFNRFLISDHFHVDLGFRYSDTFTLVDHSPRHGFSHLDYLGGYAGFFGGLKWLKVGLYLGTGMHRNFAVYVSTPTLRGTVRF